MTGTRLDLGWTVPVQKDGAFPTYVELPGSEDALGTRRPVKVSARVDGHDFDATLMPSGTGPHWLPLRAAVCAATGKGAAGDVVAVRLTARR